jgi:hypothetical protein
VLRVWGLTAAPPPPTAKPIAAQVFVDGTVTQLDGMTCTVAGTKVLLSKQTTIDPGIAVGTAVTAVGLRAPDGSILGIRISKH